MKYLFLTIALMIIISVILAWHAYKTNCAV